MNELVIGGGGREHAIVQALNRSPRTGKIYASPGNPGIGEYAECVRLDLQDTDQLVAFCREHAVHLVVFGPEQPLVQGVGEALGVAGIRYFGPSQAAARLEGSKSFAKEVMVSEGILTADYLLARTIEEAKDAVGRLGFPLFFKADGLCGGKGALPVPHAQALREVLKVLFEERRFGKETLPVVIEKCLPGKERSVFAICNGLEYAIVPLDIQDYKRRDEGPDELNTGGMGGYSLAKPMSEEMQMLFGEKIIKPTLRGMHRRGTPFKGVLYVGVMMVDDVPYVLEYNVRWGDPEAQILLPRLTDDLLEICLSVAEGTFTSRQLNVAPFATVCVNIVGPDYPSSNGPRLGGPIEGLGRASRVSKDVTIFHSGTIQCENHLCAGSGRVLAVCARAPSVAEARLLAYEAACPIRFKYGEHLRLDIGEGIVE